MKNIFVRIALIGAFLGALLHGAAPITNPYDLQITQRKTDNSAWDQKVITAFGNTNVVDRASYLAAIGAQGTLALPLVGAQGGTGVANTSKTLTLGGNVTTSGGFNLTATLTGNSSITLPTTGTVASATPVPMSYLGQQLVFTGDSLTTPIAPATVSYPQYMALQPPLMGSGTFTNYAIPGVGLATLVADYSTTVYTKRPAATGSPRSILYVWIGANDYQNYSVNTPSAYIAALESYWAQAKADGFYVVAFTIMKRSGNTNNLNFLAETNRMAINNRIIRSAGWDMLVRPDLLFTNPDDTYFFSDGSHLTNPGNKLLAAAASAATMSQGSATSPSPTGTTAYTTLPVGAPAILNAAGLAFNTAGTGYVALSPDIPALGSGAWTVEGWVYIPSTVSSGAIYLLGKSGGSGIGVIRDTSTGWKIFDESAATYSDNLVFTDCWSHIAVTRSGSTVTYYLNGASLGTSTDSTTGSTLNSINLGLKAGNVSRLRVYSRALTADQILASYTRLGVFDPTDTTVTYALADTNTGQSGKTGDLTSNASVGTLNGGAFFPEGAPTTQPLIAGPAQISSWVSSSAFAYFGHKDVSGTAGSYALIQGSSGDTYVNAASGQPLTLRINNAAKVTITSSATTIGPAQIGPWAGASTSAFFGNSAVAATPGSYAIIQGTGGDTYLNSASGQPVSVRVNNSEVATMTAAGISAIGNVTTANGLLGTWSGGATTMMLTNKALAGSTDYALLHTNAGETYINSAATKPINFQINNSGVATLNATGLTTLGNVSTGTGLFGAWSGSGTSMMLVNKALSGDADYALLQINDGDTYLNAASTKSLNFRINNSEVGTWSSTLFNVVGNASVGGTFTPSQTGGIVGTTTNNDVNAGGVGEYASSAIASGSAVSLTTTTATNITSISLTAGDWDVEGNVNFSASTATVTGTSAGISATSATLPTDGSEAYSGVQVTLLSETDSVTLPRKRIRIAGTTTVYLVGRSTFSAGTVVGFGAITARRVR